MTVPAEEREIVYNFGPWATWLGLYWRVKVMRIAPYLAWMNCTGAFIYFFHYCFFYFVYIPKRVDELDSEALTPADYTLFVAGLPKQLSDEDYQKHLEEL